VCLFVCLFVREACCDFSKSKSLIFMKFGTDVQASVPNFTVSFSEVKVNVQGQNRRTESLRLVLSSAAVKISSPNLAIRQK